MPRLNVLHAIHDFLPRHQAGSEIYAYELGRELARRHHVTMLCADYDPSRRHGDVTWRVHGGLPVVELVNNWVCASFEDTYRPPVIGDRLRHVLRAVQPDVVHVHNLLNLSFDLPAIARASGIPVVATLHDYTLVCPSGGQRIHRADRHVCHVIDPNRCSRCFTESPFYTKMSLGPVAAAPRAVRGLALAVHRRLPRLASRLAAAVSVDLPVTETDIARRLAAARDVCQQVDLFVAPSASIAAEFQRLGVSPSRISVSDYGCAPRPAATPAPGGAGFSRPESRPLRIGYVGTIVWHKGLHVLLDAIRDLPLAAYELKIFGDPSVSLEYAAQLRERAEGLPVSFLGAFDRRDVAGAFKDIDVLVVPSLWLENSPLVIHEAYMAGVPVIGARIGGIPQLVRDGWNGILYDPVSASELTAALRRVIDRPECLQEFAGRLPAVKSIAEDSREWEVRYADVIGRRAGLGTGGR